MEAPANSNDDHDDVGTVNIQNTGVGSMNSTSTGVGDDPPVEVESMTEAECFQAAIDEGHAEGLSDHPSTCLQQTHHPVCDADFHYSWTLVTEILELFPSLTMADVVSLLTDQMSVK